MAATPGVRIEGDPKTPEYGMGRDLLVQACFSKHKNVRDAARLELARREWNKLVAKGKI